MDERSIDTRPSALSELEQRLELTYAAVREGIWDWDLRNDDLIWSDRLVAIAGLDRARFSPRIDTFFELLHPDDRERIRKAIDAHLEHGHPYDVEYRLHHDRGHYIHVHASGQALWDENGEPVRMVGSLEDISEKVETREALHESQTRLLNLAANLPGAIFEYTMRPDDTDELHYMSPGSLDIWELDPSVIENDPTALWEQMVEEDFPLVRDSVLRSRRTLHPWSQKWRIRTPSGELKWLHGRGLPSLQSDGTVVWNAVVLDITEQARTEEALAESRELFHRAQRMDALGQLTGGVAHDFNNLLGIILGNLELLADSTDPGEIAEFANEAIKAVERGSALTRSLLAFARRATLEPHPVAMDEVVADLRSMLRHALPENIHLEIEAEPDLPRLLLDRSALESALLNLVLNARDAMDGDGRIRISFTSPAEGGAHDDGLVPGRRVRIRVLDDGRGIDPGILGHVIEPFFTTKERKGSGLGLSMVDGFVRQSGGAMHIESEPGRGTEVTLVFPVRDVSAYDDVLTQDEEPELDRTRPRGTVLLVEDEAELRKVLGNRLRAEGYTVIEANDSAEAETAYEALPAPPDLLLTDFIMPGHQQGPDLAAALRARQPDLRIIYVSGYVDVSDARYEKAYLAADARLLKPVGKVDLLRTVRRVLQTRPPDNGSG